MQEMFCYQCEQTVQGNGCTKKGVCGKEARTAKLQDLLVQVAKDIAVLGKEKNEVSKYTDYILEALFTTVTNVNFDEDRIVEVIAEGKKCRRELGEKPEMMSIPDDKEAMIEASEKVSVEKRKEELGETPAGLLEMAVYGLKGSAAYAHHAKELGVSDPEVDRDFCELLAWLADHPTDVNALLEKVLAVGELNLRVMELLDRANTGTYGHPEPTEVRITPVAGKCILVSGHDLQDLHKLLQQTEGKGVNVYTHGEMLPCLAYPELKKYKHLVGNYGGAWQDQKKEFDEFPGAILMTTNCIQKPAETYQSRIFTTGLVAWPDVQHIGEDKDFTPVIESALSCEGFPEDAPEETIMIGFGRNAVMSVADKVVDAVKGGQLKHFFLVGGCDGAKTGRNYYTEFAQSVPEDCAILTLACGKYRFNKLPFGDIGGIPRLLDVGQCNDAYSAIVIASELAKAFDCDINELPLSMILSWYEQKAVAILLTLLYLGVKNMKLGPTLPAFVTPEVLDVLVDKFQIAPIGAPEEDLQAILS